MLASRVSVPLVSTRCHPISGEEYIPGEGLSIDRNVLNLFPDQLSQGADELR